ncbi:sister chromatid cohesion protein PDS5 [Fistulifera solaris]|uniref:Sister chromatid cohesion protein PDS5 n=1 Tax=Fistulifera solaris TaxID=1519565 RepID=A0A1Z5KHD2_FISSO|nr:sister chromatid cohesion protein PDS5 [Fistulifera solaris]|eukprot:GAX25627.1 sister chromatid cohesion protein PDS5 [Fistulifera solaris]
MPRSSRSSSRGKDNPEEEEPSHKNLLSENSRTIVQVSFLSTDLKRHLQKLLHVLQTDETIECDSRQWPGLAAVAERLPQLFQHNDKQVRLLATACSLEILCLYAPNVPWDDEVLLEFFRQLLRQLGNLSHTLNAEQPNYTIYLHMLSQLAVVKVGAVLTDEAMERPAALEVLVEFLHTLLHSIRHKHSSAVMDLAQEAIGVCLDEYHQASLPVPVVLLDELLIAVGQGPTTQITELHPETKLPQAVAVPNPTHRIAAALLQAQVHLQMPVSQLINGLLTNDTLALEQSSISKDSESETVHLYKIIYHLYAVVPQYLTTVLGTLAQGLSSDDTPQRQAVTYWWGKLLLLHTQQRQSFLSLWLPRAKDIHAPIREIVIRACVPLLRSLSVSKTAVAHDDHKEIEHVLQEVVMSDPAKSVRLLAVHELCDAEYNQAGTVSSKLLQAVASRIPSKDAAERKDALTGLAQIYAKHGALQENLQSGLEILPGRKRKLSSRDPEDDEDDEEGSYDWIPRKLLEACHFSDKLDSALRSRLYQIMDDVLVGKQSRPAIALVWMMQHLDDSALQSWLSLLKGRFEVQRLLSKYLQLRSQAKRDEGADAVAYQALQGTAALLPTPKSEQFLEKLHKAKDQHMFRILAGICDPNHACSARKRAMEDLVARTKASLGDDVADWMKQVVRRVAMGNSVNETILEDCVVLAQEMWEEEHLVTCSKVLECIHHIVGVFPSLGGKKFETLCDIYHECRAKSEKNHPANAMATLLSETIARMAESGKITLNDADAIEWQLSKVCTSSNSPLQARHATSTLISLFHEERPEIFSKLLRTLTGRLGSTSAKLTCALAALSVLEEKIPSLDPTRSSKAFEFVLNSVIIGDDESSNSAIIMGERDDDEEDSENEDRPVSRKRGQHSTPDSSKHTLEDESVSESCRRLVAAMEFLTACVRSNRAQQAQKVVELLLQLLRDNGCPWSSRDQAECRSRQDRAALRKCAGIQVLRLCEGRVGVERNLTPAQWHVLSQVFLDEEMSVRAAVIMELAAFLRGEGVYGKSAPPLRFVALLVLCVDDHFDRGSGNGNAANVGSKAIATIKHAATQCIAQLRKTCEATYLQCQAAGDAAERKYENFYKMMLMPEYIVPYAIHILVHRSETSRGQSDDGARRVLIKRLKSLFEPLILSLGDSADNISFLLQMMNVLGKQFIPNDVSPVGQQTEKKSQLLRAKLKNVCSEAREILLTFVKKDVHLATYPGTVQIPSKLFTRRSPTTIVSRPPPPEFSPQTTPGGRTVGSRRSVHFSPDVRPTSGRRAPLSTVQSETPSEGFALSPIAHSKSPSPLASSGKKQNTFASGGKSASSLTVASRRSPRLGTSISPASEKTMGATPPSNLRGVTIQSTQESTPSTNEVSPSQTSFVVEEVLERRKDGNVEENMTAETQSTDVSLPALRENARKRLRTSKKVELSQEKIAKVDEENHPVRRNSRRNFRA